MTIKRITVSYISTLKTNMTSFGFRLKKIDETRNYFLEEIKHNDLMSEKHKKTLNECNRTRTHNHLVRK